MNRIRLFLVALVASLVLPVLAFAQDAPAAVAEGGIALGMVIAGLGVASALLTMASKLFPGWGTYINIAVGAIASLTPQLTEMSAQSEKISLVGLVMAALGAVVGKARANTRAKG